MPYWVAIAAGIAATATTIAGAVSYSQTEEAGEEAKKLSEQGREDQLRQFEVTTGLKQQQLRLQREQQESAEYFNMGQLRNQRKQLQMQETQSAFGRATTQYGMLMDVLNQDVNLRNSLIAKLQRRPQGVGYGL